MNNKKNSSPKLRIKFQSYDVRMLESSVFKVVSLLMKSGASVVGPIPLPKRRKMYTLTKANFKHKDGREQYERIVYSRLVDVVHVGPKTMEHLQNLSIPVGVLVDVKVF